MTLLVTALFSLGVRRIGSVLLFLLLLFFFTSVFLSLYFMYLLHEHCCFHCIKNPRGLGMVYVTMILEGTSSIVYSFLWLVVDYYSGGVVGMLILLWRNVFCHGRRKLSVALYSLSVLDYVVVGGSLFLVSVM